MPIRKSDIVPLGQEMTDNIFVSIESYIKKITSYLEDDDWSLIIKLHALVEAAVSEILANKTDDSIRKIIERLPLSDNSTGKGRMAFDMGIISESQYRFLRRFSELRNNLVHKIDNVDFNLAEYVNGLDKNQRKSWKVMLSWSAPGMPDSELDESDVTHPRTGVYLSVLRLLMGFAVENQLALMNKKVLELSDKTERELLLSAGVQSI